MPQWSASALLLPKDLFDLAGLFLNFSGYLFFFAFYFQVGILAEFPGDFLDLALHLVDLAFYLVMCTAGYWYSCVSF